MMVQVAYGDRRCCLLLIPYKVVIVIPMTSYYVCTIVEGLILTLHIHKVSCLACWAPYTTTNYVHAL
jgi:hypothetical protein